MIISVPFIYLGRKTIIRVDLSNGDKFPFMNKNDKRDGGTINKRAQGIFEGIVSPSFFLLRCNNSLVVGQVRFRRLIET